jgi:hypothetical protein
MEHTSLVAGGAGGGILRKASADVDPDPQTANQQKTQTTAEGATETGPPQDLSLLVNQLYSELKRELMIERERRGGMY